MPLVDWLREKWLLRENDLSRLYSEQESMIIQSRRFREREEESRHYKLNRPFIWLKKKIIKPLDCFFSKVSPYLQVLGIVAIPVLIFILENRRLSQESVFEGQREKQQAVGNYLSRINNIYLQLKVGNQDKSVREQIENDEELRKFLEVTTIAIFDELSISENFRSKSSESVEFDWSAIENDHKGKVVDFLSNLGWINSLNDEEVLLSLSESNLSQANLRFVNLKRANLIGANLIGADLERANLIGANLIGADLRGANLDGVDLIEANLSRTDLIVANLIEANLSRTKMCAVNLNGADLIKANLGFINLRRTNLSRTNLREANLIKANLGFINLSRTNLREADLREADLRFTNLREADLSGAILIEAELSGAILMEAVLSEAYLMRANLTAVFLCKASLSAADLSGAYLMGAILSEANLSETNFYKANLSGAHLWRANLSETNFYKANLNKAKLLDVINLTSEQIKLACNWEKAIYKEDESENRKYIEHLKKDKLSDPTETPDCSK